MSGIEDVGGALAPKTPEQLAEAKLAAATGTHPDFPKWQEGQMQAHIAASERIGTEAATNEDFQHRNNMLYQGLVPTVAHHEFARHYEARNAKKMAAHQALVDSGERKGAFNARTRENTVNATVVMVHYDECTQGRSQTRSGGRGNVRTMLPVTVRETIRFGDLSKDAQEKYNAARVAHKLDPLSPALHEGPFGQERETPDFVSIHTRIVVESPPSNKETQVPVRAGGRDTRPKFELQQPQKSVSDEAVKSYVDENDWIPVTNAKTLELYHERKGKMEVPGGEPQAYPDPSLKELLADPDISEKELEQAMNTGRGRLLAANARFERGGTCGLVATEMANLHHRAAGTPNVAQAELDRTGERPFDATPKLQIPVDAQGAMSENVRYPATGQGDLFINADRALSHIRPVNRDQEQEYLMEQGRKAAQAERVASGPSI